MIMSDSPVFSGVHPAHAYNVYQALHPPLTEGPGYEYSLTPHLFLSLSPTDVILQNLKLFESKTREEIAQLVKCGAKVNTRRGDQATPLMVHAQKGNFDVVQELLQHFANTDLRDEVCGANA